MVYSSIDWPVPWDWECWQVQGGGGYPASFLWTWEWGRRHWGSLQSRIMHPKTAAHHHSNSPKHSGEIASLYRNYLGRGRPLILLIRPRLGEQCNSVVRRNVINDSFKYKLNYHFFDANEVEMQVCEVVSSGWTWAQNHGYRPSSSGDTCRKTLFLLSVLKVWSVLRDRL